MKAVLEPELESIGSVEGVLEGLIVHGKRRFVIYDAPTGRQITCCFGDWVELQHVTEAFVKRVAATGVIRARRSGEKASILVNRLHVFPPEEQLPSAERVLAALKAAQ